MEINGKMKPPALKLKPALTNNASRHDTFTFIWHLKNFDMCPNQWGKCVKSPDFRFYNWQDPRFHLLFYAGGVNEQNSKYLSLYLVKTSNENDSYNIKLGIITNKDKKILYEASKKLDRGSGAGAHKFLEKDKLQNSEDDCFLQDGNLTLFCEIKAPFLSRTTNHSIIYEFREDLSDAYATIYESEKYCDLYLHVGEKTFKVHKAIVEARFPDLMKNIDENKCKIKCIGSTTMNALLRYMYTGILNIYEINLFEILSSGYELPAHLKRLLLEKQNKMEITTCFQKNVISFSWNIQNFSSLDSSNVIRYPLIGDYNVKWTWLDLFLSTTGDETPEEYITISIQRFSKDCKRIACKIETSDQSETFSHTYEKDDKWTLPNFFSKDKLKSSTSDEISLNFEITLSDGSKTSETNKSEIIPRASSVNKTAEDLISFQKDLLSILNAPKFFDVTLMSGKEKFHAHKFILSARSPVFCEMFQSETAKKNFEIVVDGVETSVIKDMLDYMYWNDVKFSSYDANHVNNLYSLASRYKLAGMKEKCVFFLKLNISADTAGDILISAHEFDSEELKELVYDFVCAHPQEISDSKMWERVMLKRSDLVLQVLNKTLSHLAAKNNSTIEDD